MLRRRPLRRPLGAARRKLMEARELLERGEFAPAAEAFAELARGAEQRGMLDRAGDLRLQVARCSIKLGDIERANTESLQALRLFVRARRPLKVRRLLPKMLAFLEEQGKHAEAEELRQKAEELLQGLPVGGRPGAGAALAQGKLPGKCPNCGGPIKPSEVNWVGQGSAECPYCGSVVAAE